MAVPKPMRIEFGIRQRLESCAWFRPITLVFPSRLLFIETFEYKFWPEILAWNSDLKFRPGILAWNFGLKFRPGILAWNFGLEFRLRILAWNFGLEFWPEKFRPEILAWKNQARNFGLENRPEFQARNFGLKCCFGSQMNRPVKICQLLSKLSGGIFQFRSTWELDWWPIVFSTNWQLELWWSSSHLDDLDKSLKKYGSLSC